jgi:2-C-methyl-D-erythritol 4-phosphate cytidylyltransferase
VWSIVVAGGSGLRYGARKQFVPLHGVSVLQRAVGAAAAVSEGVVAVVPEDSVDRAGVTTTVTTELCVVAGGATRAESVRRGLDRVPDTCDVILVHDAARPLASVGLFSAVIAAVESGAEAVVPGVPIADSVRHVDGGALDRAALVAVQTPQGFTAEALRRAHAAGHDATDDATLAEAVGVTVTVIGGEPENRKITDPSDLVAAEAILEQRED